MFEYKIILGIVAVIISFVSYVPYFRDIILKKTKPHAFTWLVWAILIGIAFFGQIFEGGGPGAWVTCFTAIVSLVIFFIAFKRGEKEITFSDKLSLVGAGFALVLWYITHNPLASILLIILIDAFGFYPTFRKSYYKPHEETISTYFLGGLKFAISILALQHYSLVTYLYPAYLVFMNFGLVIYLIIRRKEKKKIWLTDHGF